MQESGQSKRSWTELEEESEERRGVRRKGGVVKRMLTARGWNGQAAWDGRRQP